MRKKWLAGRRSQVSYMGIEDGTSQMVDAALALAERGWRVFPAYSVVDGRCTCGNSSCTSPGKHPAFPRWQEKATDNARDIQATDWNCRNLAVATGRQSNLLVVDLDGTPGLASWSDLTARHHWKDSTLTATTGGGGRHLYYQHPTPQQPIGNRVRLFPGIDVRADGGLVIAPPSTHVAGQYRWQERDRNTMPAPEWLLRALESPQRPTAGIGTISEGERNVTLFRLACSLRGRGIPEHEIRAHILDVNERQCRPRLSPLEVGRIIQSALRYPPGNSERKKLLWFPTSPASILAATHPWRMMTPTQRGLFWQLLLETWANSGILPTDMAALWRLAGADSLEQFEAECGPVLSDFEAVEIDGKTFLVSKTIENACAEICPRFVKQRENGMLGGRPRRASDDQVSPIDPLAIGNCGGPQVSHGKPMGYRKKADIRGKRQ